MKIDISKFFPCDGGKKYYEQFPSFKEAWESCHRGDWMIWIAAKLGVDRRTLTLAAGLCANTVRHLMTDERSTAAVDAAIAYGRGEIDEEELKEAREGAWEVARTAAWAAQAAAAAAEAADAAACARAVAAAAWAAADAAFFAAGSDLEAAMRENQLQTANICREILTDKVFGRINENKKY